MLERIEQTRLDLSQATISKKKAQLGQFLTPASIARFMAGMFTAADRETCRLLDPGAGIGSLSAAFLERCARGELAFSRIELDAYELDASLLQRLSRSIQDFSSLLNLTASIRGEDFIPAAVKALRGDLFMAPLPLYTHAILNPPYKKIRANSHHNTQLRQVGFQTVNLYSAFAALTLALLENRGQLVAIIPRSFCNGPYYRPFRAFILNNAAIRRMHLFESRTKAFKDDDVLQENIIIMLERGAAQGDVVVSTSTDDTFTDSKTHIHSFDRIVFPSDPEKFIHVPTSGRQTILEQTSEIRHSLDDIGVSVSTGPVVDFRMKDHLRDMPEAGSVPLLYPCHFSRHRIEWPKPEGKKPNAIALNAATRKWLYPKGYYCVVRRFSSKEEKRRIVAGVVSPDDFPDAANLGFENHLNVFHADRHGLPELLAHGLSAYLNTTAVNEHFRRFNGHTQVNATDLRTLKYPGKEDLMTLGQWAKNRPAPSQEMLDEQLKALSA